MGILGIANAVPAILLGVIGAVFADPGDKRRLIMATQAGRAWAIDGRDRAGSAQRNVKCHYTNRRPDEH